jgi:hypothetical protein
MLFNSNDHRHLFDDAATHCIVGSFPVDKQFGGKGYSRNASHKGWSDQCFAMKGESLMVVAIENANPEAKIVCIDLAASSGSYEADAFDNKPPETAEAAMYVMANHLVNWAPLNILGLGKNVNEAIDIAMNNVHGNGKSVIGATRTRQYNTRSGTMVTFEHLQHPTVLSTFLSGNWVALKAAINYYLKFKNCTVDFRSSVMLSLRSKDHHGLGGLLKGAVTLRYMEVLRGVADKETEALSNVVAHGVTLNVFTNNDAEATLKASDRNHLVPYSLTGLYLSDMGIEGGTEEAYRLASLHSLRVPGLQCFRQGGKTEDEKKLFREQNEAARFVNLHVPGGYSGPHICVTKVQLDLLVGASGLNDSYRFKSNEDLVQQLKAEDGHISGGIEEAYRLASLHSLRVPGLQCFRQGGKTEDKKQLFREQNEAARLVNLHVPGGFTGSNIHATKAQLDLLVGASGLNDSYRFKDNEDVIQQIKAEDARMSGGLIGGQGRDVALLKAKRDELLQELTALDVEDQSKEATDKRASLMKEISMIETALAAAVKVKADKSRDAGQGKDVAPLRAKLDELRKEFAALDDEDQSKEATDKRASLMKEIASTEVALAAAEGNKRFSSATGGYARAKYIVEEDFNTFFPEESRCPNFPPDLSGDQCGICRNPKCTYIQRGKPGHLPRLPRCGEAIAAGTKANITISGESDFKKVYFRHRSLCTCMKKKEEVFVNNDAMDYALFNCSREDRTNFLATMEQNYRAKVTAKREYVASEEARNEQSHQQFQMQQSFPFQYPYQMQQSFPFQHPYQIHQHESSTSVTANSSSGSIYGMIDNTSEVTATGEATLEFIEESDSGYVGV